MIPDLPNLSDWTVYGRFVQPYNRLKMPLEDYARGGVQLNDSSQGLDVKNWRIELKNGVCKISAAGSPDFIVTNVPEQATWVSLGFDQNMHHNVAYIFNGTGYFYWYDAASNSYVTSNFGNIRCPIVRMDDVRDISVSTNDLVLSYIKDGSLCVRIQRDRFGTEYVLARNVGNRLFQAGLNTQLRFQWQIGAIYPESLPCPQADTDLVPRERRYLSEIGDVRNLRMFQQEFQATRNKINFIFTEEEAAEFRDWYENGIFHGGAWFYADWPLLHTDKLVAHRFVGQPKWEWIFGGNPGKQGRSSYGTVSLPADAVTMYKVSATVEVYERKIETVYLSKLYPFHFTDEVSSNVIIKTNPFTSFNDDVRSAVSIVRAEKTSFATNEYDFEDDVESSISIPSISTIKYIYSDYSFDDNVVSHCVVVSGETVARVILYDRAFDDVVSSVSILGVETNVQ